MKTTIAVSIAALLSAAWLLATRDAVSFPPHDRASLRISARKLSNVPLRRPAVLELNYFERQKQLGSWIARYSEPGGIRRTLSDRNATQGEHSMRVHWRTRRWGNLSFIHFPQDWSSYTHVKFDVFSENAEPLRCEIRIADYFDASSLSYHESKYLKRLTLGRGLERVSLPLDEIAPFIDIRSPRKIIHFRVLDHDRIFYLDNLRLERAP